MNNPKVTITIDCPMCWGDGIDYGRETCRACIGTVRVGHEVTLSEFAKLLREAELREGTKQ